MSKESGNNNWVSRQLSANSSYSKHNPGTVLKAGDYKITVHNHFCDINPFELMQKLYILGNNEQLSKEEKEKKLKKIIQNSVE